MQPPRNRFATGASARRKITKMVKRVACLRQTFWRDTTNAHAACADAIPITQNAPPHIAACFKLPQHTRKTRTAAQTEANAQSNMPQLPTNADAKKQKKGAQVHCLVRLFLWDYYEKKIETPISRSMRINPINRSKIESFAFMAFKI